MGQKLLHVIPEGPAEQLQVRLHFPEILLGGGVNVHVSGQAGGLLIAADKNLAAVHPGGAEIAAEALHASMQLQDDDQTAGLVFAEKTARPGRR